MGLPIIHTERFVLRPWSQEDVDALHALWAAPEVRGYLWDHVVITRETTEQIINSHMATVERHGIGYWALLAPPPAKPPALPIAGFCGFRFMDDGPDIELIYGLRAEYWGQGLATEACLASIEYLWRSTRFPVLYARTDPPNERSVRVMQRIGMMHESTSAALITYVLRRPGAPAESGRD
jgi:RimJ/RimL family protein N-acetyltransferase